VLFKRVDGVETALGDAQTLNVVPLYLSMMNESDRRKCSSSEAPRSQREVMGAEKLVADALTRIQYIRRALDEVEGGDAQLTARVNAADTALRDIAEMIGGDAVRRQRNEPTPPSLLDRVSNAVAGLSSTQPPTQTYRESLRSRNSSSRRSRAAAADVGWSSPRSKRMNEIGALDARAVAAVADRKPRERSRGPTACQSPLPRGRWLVGVGGQVRRCSCAISAPHPGRAEPVECRRASRDIRAPRARAAQYESGGVASHSCCPTLDRLRTSEAIAA
jgi:hypothetical protein